MKTKIIIKTTYIGEDKPHLKNGHHMSIICPKDQLIASYMDYNIRQQYNDLQTMPLLTFVRKVIQKIRQSGSPNY